MRTTSTILDDLGSALEELQTTVQREFPDDAQASGRVLERCRVVRAMQKPGVSDLRELAGTVSGFLADRPGSLGEAIIPRDDYDERCRLNEEFDALRLRIRRLAAELDDAGRR